MKLQLSKVDTDIDVIVKKHKGLIPTDLETSLLTKKRTEINKDYKLVNDQRIIINKNINKYLLNVIAPVQKIKG